MREALKLKEPIASAYRSVQPRHCFVGTMAWALSSSCGPRTLETAGGSSHGRSSCARFIDWAFVHVEGDVHDSTFQPMPAELARFALMQLVG